MEPVAGLPDGAFTAAYPRAAVEQFVASGALERRRVQDAIEAAHERRRVAELAIGDAAETSRHVEVTLVALERELAERRRAVEAEANAIVTRAQSDATAILRRAHLEATMVNTSVDTSAHGSVHSSLHTAVPTGPTPNARDTAPLDASSRVTPSATATANAAGTDAATTGVASTATATEPGPGPGRAHGPDDDESEPDLDLTDDHTMWRAPVVEQVVEPVVEQVVEPVVEQAVERAFEPAFGPASSPDPAAGQAVDPGSGPADPAGGVNGSNGAHSNGDGSAPYFAARESRSAAALSTLLRRSRPHPVEVADTEADEFFDFLRGALSDDEPLGPRDPDVEQEG